jgi:hypothetical protein
MEIPKQRHLVLIFLLALWVHGKAASLPDMQPSLDSLKNKLNRVNNYSADVSISLNVSFIRIPVRSAKVYYKKPDKVRIKSKDFVMLPKKGINFQLQDLLNKPYTAVWIRREKRKGQMCEVIKLIPLNDNPEVIVATLWLDRRNSRLMALDANTRENGSFSIGFGYTETPDAYDLPRLLQFTFEVNKMSLPMGITGEFDVDERSRKPDGPEKATLTLKYSNFLINKGIDDSVFSTTP